MRRRTFLALLSGLVAVPITYGGYYAFRYVRRGDVRPMVRAIIERHFDSLTIERESKEKFIASFSAGRGALRGKDKKLWLGYADAYQSPVGVFVDADTKAKFRVFEDDVVSSFVLGSDLPEQGATARVVRYVEQEQICVARRIEAI